jgi:hypothetical protein
MTADLETHKTPDGYELRSGDGLLGTLTWAATRRIERSCPGWWLDRPGHPPELISEVPINLAGDLEAAREATESAALGFAELMVGDPLLGLLDPV